jgi:hypothetical protein
MSELDSMFFVAGVHLTRVGMQLATVKQKRNAAILQVIKKEGTLRCLSELLQIVQAKLEQARCDNPTRDNSVLSPKSLLLVIKR